VTSILEHLRQEIGESHSPVPCTVYPTAPWTFPAAIQIHATKSRVRSIDALVLTKLINFQVNHRCKTQFKQYKDTMEAATRKHFFNHGRPDVSHLFLDRAFLPFSVRQGTARAPPQILPN